MRAKSIAFEELAEVGTDVAKFLKKKLKTDGETEVGYFPRYGVAGGIRPIHDLDVMSLKDIHSLSDQLNRDVLSRFGNLETTVVIKDDFLIFGGDFGGLGGLGGGRFG
jgi:hypothetical protein